MKDNETAKKGMYVGTGAGIILFVLVGLFPGSLIGGAIGLKLTSMILGSPVEPSLLPRLITAASMLLGIFGAALTFIVGFSILGWAGGVVVSALQASKAPEAEMEKARETHV